MRRSYEEIGEFLNQKVKDLAFDNLDHFVTDFILFPRRFVSDKEVSHLLYETASFLGSSVPEEFNTSRFTLYGLVDVLNHSSDDKFSKQQLAKGLRIHKQTLTKWLEEFAPDLHLDLHQKRKINLIECYKIVDSLGFIESNRIMSRQDLVESCNLKSSELRRNLPDEMVCTFDKFIKYPPVFSNMVLELFDLERHQYLIWKIDAIDDNFENRVKLKELIYSFSSLFALSRKANN